MEIPNLDKIKKITEGDKDFLLKITTILKEEFPKEKYKFYKKHQENDLVGIANLIHKMKYKFDLLSLEEDFKIASQFEKEIKTGNKKLFPKIENILLKIERYLETI